MSFDETCPKGVTPFGDWVFDMAGKKDIDLRKLADRIGCTPATLRGYMTGVRYPKLDTYIAICEVFSEDREEFWKMVENGIRSLPEFKFCNRRLRYAEQKREK